MALFRIDKYLCDMGVGTRSEVKNYIKKGRVTVDGNTIKSSDLKIDSDTAVVTFDGNVIAYVTVEYFMLNKPQGVISATEDSKDKTVIDLIEGKNRKDLFPVGRLDKDTEGLLLITNDGMLAHNLLSPKKHVDKVYYVECDGTITSSMVSAFGQGVELEDGTMTKPAILEILGKNEVVALCPNNNLQYGYSRAKITIREGKFHQIKRMFEAFGMNVIYLKRLSMGSLILDDNLKCGEYRELTDEEINSLKEFI